MLDDRNGNDGNDQGDSNTGEDSFGQVDTEILEKLTARVQAEIKSAFKSKLLNTTLLSEIEDLTFRAVLRLLCQEPRDGQFKNTKERSLRIYGTVLNACYTQGQAAFLATGKDLDTLIKLDSKIQGKHVRHLASISGDYYKHFTDFIGASGAHQWLDKVYRPPEGSRKAAVFEVVDPVIRPLLDKKFGKSELDAITARIKEFASRWERENEEAAGSAIPEAPSEVASEVASEVPSFKAPKALMSTNPTDPTLQQGPQTDKTLKPTLPSMGPGKEGTADKTSGQGSSAAVTPGVVSLGATRADCSDPLFMLVRSELGSQIRDINRIMLLPDWKEAPVEPDLFNITHCSLVTTCFDEANILYRQYVKLALEQYQTDDPTAVTNVILDEAALTYVDSLNRFREENQNYKANGSRPMANIVSDVIANGDAWGIFPSEAYQSVLSEYYGRLRVSHPERTHLWEQVEQGYRKLLSQQWPAKAGRFRVKYDDLFFKLQHSKPKE